MTANGCPESTGSNRPGTGPASRDPGRDRVTVDAERSGGDRGSERVGQVEQPAQRNAELDPLPVAARRPHVAFDLRDISERVRLPGHLHAVDEQPAPFVVDVV